MKRLLLILALGWGCSGIGLAQAPDTLFISTSQVVHLRFASELKYVNLGSKDIVARIVDGSKDFVAVKAREAFSGVTSLSCLESTGTMHTFLVAYREHPSRLDIDTRGYNIDIQCENLFVKDDVLFLLISVRNDSAVSYELSTPRFAVESRRRTKRGLQYEKAVFPKQSYGLGVIDPASEGRLVFTFYKMALLRGQVFRVSFYEKGGARNLTLTLS